MEAIFYDGQLAAIAAPKRVYLAPQIDALPDNHPVLRVVFVMCVYAREVQSGLLPAPYTDEAAERFAREVLIPEECESVVMGLRDDQAAAALVVPVREVARRRAEFAEKLGVGGARGVSRVHRQ